MRIRALWLACAVAIAATGCASIGRKPNFDAETLGAASLLELSAAEIALRFGEPRRMLNIGGIGFYGYADYGFYFDDIVFYHQDGMRVRIADSAARILLVDCLDADGVMGIRRGKSLIEDIEARLGRPDSIKVIEGGGEIFNPFAGTYYLYRLGRDLFAVRVGKGLAEAVLLVSERNAFFR